MRLASQIVLVLSVALWIGCSNQPDSEGSAGSSSHPAAYQPKGNGKPMGEAAACDSLMNAIESNVVQRLKCPGVTVLACPDYIRASVSPQENCLQYDEGTIRGCTDFYATFTSCGDFSSRPCHISYIAGSAPAGCQADGGSNDAARSDANTALDGTAEAAEEESGVRADAAGD